MVVSYYLSHLAHVRVMFVYAYNQVKLIFVHIIRHKSVDETHTYVFIIAEPSHLFLNGR